MKLFISYAHVNLPRVRQLADFLRMGGHDIWFDQRLVGGQSWKDQLRTQIKSSQCFLYALTPPSLASAWCQWEFAQAVHMGKKIITVLLEPCHLEGVLSEHHYVDFTQGDSFEAGLRLGTAVFAAQPIPPEKVPLLPAPDEAPPERQIARHTPEEAALVSQLYEEAYQVYRAKAYDEAHELLHDLLYIAPDYADARHLLKLVERRQTNSPSAAMPPAPAPRIDVPPAAGLRVLPVVDMLPQPFAWVDIPAGRVALRDGHGAFEVPAFSIAKYPVTNAQFQVFTDAQDGYREPQWWAFSKVAFAWWEVLREPARSSFEGDDLPRTEVNWYEAVAFCRWLAAKTGESIMLPTEQQWQRAAQGDDGRNYPWGNQEPDDELCNWDRTIGQPTPVTRYPAGASPYGVMDMAGNVWEWCLNKHDSPENTSLTGAAWRVLRGGGWDGSQVNARAAYRLSFDPRARSLNGGFRVCCVRPPSEE